MRKIFNLVRASINRIAWPFGLWLIVGALATVATFALQTIDLAQLGADVLSAITSQILILPIALAAAFTFGISELHPFLSRLTDELHDMVQNIFGAYTGLAFATWATIEIFDLEENSSRIALTASGFILCAVALGCFAVYPTNTENRRGVKDIRIVVLVYAIAFLAYWAWIFLSRLT